MEVMWTRHCWELNKIHNKDLLTNWRRSWADDMASSMEQHYCVYENVTRKDQVHKGVIVDSGFEQLFLIPAEFIHQEEVGDWCCAALNCASIAKLKNAALQAIHFSAKRPHQQGFEKNSSRSKSGLRQPLTKAVCCDAVHARNHPQQQLV